MKLGFIGFGGAAYGLAKGLGGSAAGLIDIAFYDSQVETAGQGRLIRTRAAETGATPCKDLGELIQDAEIIISCVTGSVALDVARQAAGRLQPHHLYVDVNTAAPATMEKIGQMLQPLSVPFADVAMLGGIPTFLHEVPCVASGSGAESFKRHLSPYGMDISVVGENPGQASAIKLFRSIFMKGFLAVLIEMLIATRHYRVDAVVLESIARTRE